MGILSLLLVGSLTFASPAEMTADQANEVFKGWNEQGFHKEHCHSTQEYIKTLEFFRKESMTPIPEKQAREISGLVAQGCDGAAERFTQAYLTMKKTGVSLQKAVEVGLALAKASPLTVKNFYEIFQKTYLGDFFNLPFETSFEIAYQLSKDFRGNLETARTDFNKIGELCLSNKSIGLPVPECALYAVRLAKLGEYYPKGVYDSFQEVYPKLREDKRFGLPIGLALDVSYRVLSHGPMAKINFLQAFNYAIDKKGLDLDGKPALDFALKMSQFSTLQNEPPIFPGEQMFRRSEETPKK